MKKKKMRLMKLFLLSALSVMAFSGPLGAAGAADSNAAGNSAGAPGQNAGAGASGQPEPPSENSNIENFHRLADTLYRARSEKLERGMDIAEWGLYAMFGGLLAGIWVPEVGMPAVGAGMAVFAAGCYYAFKASSSKTGRETK